MLPGRLIARDNVVNRKSMSPAKAEIDKGANVEVIKATDPERLPEEKEAKQKKAEPK